MIPGGWHTRRTVRRVLAILGALVLVTGLALGVRQATSDVRHGVKLYWLIVTGLRAEPERFAVLQWAREGKLPVLARLIASGTSGHSMPDFPTTELVGLASLTTGAHPFIHGVTDPGIRARVVPPGSPILDAVPAPDLKTLPVWDLLAAAGAHVAVLSHPGVAVPPRATGLTDDEAQTDAEPSLVTFFTVTATGIQVVGPAPASKVDLDAHARATARILDTHHPNAFVQVVDLAANLPPPTAWPDPGAPPTPELLAALQKIDAILAAAMTRTSNDTVIALSSDRGLDPIQVEVRLNNLFASRGWLVTTMDAATGAVTIDWSKTRVVYVDSAHVYINPQGLASPTERALGPAYEHLRDDVVAALTALVDEGGTAPLAKAVRWEEAPGELGLPGDRVGDLVIIAARNVGWSEAITSDGLLFAAPSSPTFASAQDPRTSHGLWTPFVVAGPGVRRGHALAQPITHVDQLPTLLQALGLPIPDAVQGHPIGDIAGSGSQTR